MTEKVTFDIEFTSQGEIADNVFGFMIPVQFAAKDGKIVGASSVYRLRFEGHGGHLSMHIVEETHQ